MDRPLVCPILVISSEWRTRALLAAQLGETTGREVISVPGVDEALVLLRVARVAPALLVVDAGQDLSAAEVERLRAAVPDAGLVLVASALRSEHFLPLGGSGSALLVRPVTIGEIAQAAAEALEVGGAGRRTD